MRNYHALPYPSHGDIFSMSYPTSYPQQWKKTPVCGLTPTHENARRVSSWQPGRYLEII